MSRLGSLCMIETRRLLLREYTLEDFDALYEIMSDSETMQHYPAPFDEARTRRWIKWNLDNKACDLICEDGVVALDHD